MKKNWKTFFGKCIYQNSNGIKVFDNYFYRWLTFSSPFIQSLIFKIKPHKPELQYIYPLSFASRKNLGETCVLGLGGGGLIHFLQASNIKLTAVEVNSEVIKIANRYFGIEDNLQTQIIHADGAEFLQSKQNKYQNILIDMHDSHEFPKKCLNHEFFQNCKNCLTADGVLAINVTNNADRDSIYTYLYKTFATKVISIPVPGYANVILLASDEFNTDYMLNHITQSHEVKRVIWDNKFGYVLDYKF